MRLYGSSSRISGLPKTHQNFGSHVERNSILGLGLEVVKKYGYQRLLEEACLEDLTGEVRIGLGFRD